MDILRVLVLSFLNDKFMLSVDRAKEISMARLFRENDDEYEKEMEVLVVGIASTVGSLKKIIDMEDDDILEYTILMLERSGDKDMADSLRSEYSSDSGLI